MGESNLLSGVKVVMDAWLRGFDCDSHELYILRGWDWFWRHTLAVVSVSTVLPVVFTVADIFHIPVAVIRASGAIAVTSVVVSLASIILSRRIVATPAAGGGHTTTARGAFTAWGTIATRP